MLIIIAKSLLLPVCEDLKASARKTGSRERATTEVSGLQAAVAPS